MERVYAQVSIKEVFPPAENFSQIGPLVSVIVKNGFMLAGVIAFVLIVLGGFGIIAGAGGDTKQLEQGKKTITGAVIGLLVIVGSFWIVQIIETLTGLTLIPK